MSLYTTFTILGILAVAVGFFSKTRASSAASLSIAGLLWLVGDLFGGKSPVIDLAIFLSFGVVFLMKKYG